MPTASSSGPTPPGGGGASGSSGSSSGGSSSSGASSSSGSTSSTHTASRKGVWVFVVAVVAVGALIWGIIIWTNHSSSVSDLVEQANGQAGATATATATTTATLTETTAPSSAVAVPPAATTAPSTPPDCIDRNLPGYALDVTLRHEAADTAGAAADLAALRAAGSKYVTVDYSGAFTPNSDDVVAWMKAAACNGFRTRVGLDEVFKNLSLADAKAYISRIDAQANQAGYLLSASPYAIPGDLTPEARMQVLHEREQAVSEVSHLGTVVMTDFINISPVSTAVTATKAFGGEQQVPVYLPWEDSSYGPVSDYALVGQIGAQTGGAAVQAFDNGTGLPSPGDVKSFAQMLRDNGAKNVLVYTEGAAAGDMNYLAQVSQGVAEVLAN